MTALKPKTLTEEIHRIRIAEIEPLPERKTRTESNNSTSELSRNKSMNDIS
jgi:hypothetical protein